MKPHVFSISLGSSLAVVGEPVRVSFRLRAGASPLPVPLPYRVSDVVTIEVLSSEGALIAAGDGYAKRERIGLAGNFVAQSTMAAETLGPGQEITWDETLVNYVGELAPGSYHVRARFSFEPAEIDLPSEAAGLEVRPHRCCHLDVVSDKVLLATTTTLAQHREGDTSRTFARIARTKTPGAFWEGTSLPVPAGAEARVSEADFTTTHTFSHDFARVVAWVDPVTAALSFTTFAESNAPTKVVSVPLGVPNPRLVGRPIRHADESFTAVFTSGDASATRVVEAIHLDPDGTLRRRQGLVSLYPQNEPIALAPDTHGNLYLATCSSPSGPPLLLIARDPQGAITSHEIVTRTEDLFREEAYSAAPRARSPLRLLGVCLAVKAHLSPRAVLFAAALDHRPDDPNQDDLLVIAQAFLDAPPEGVPPLQAQHVVLPRGTLARGERPFAAALARTRRREFHALVSTSHGRLLHVKPDGRTTWPAQMPADRAALVALVTTQDHDVHAFFASDEVGVEGVLLERPARP